MEQPGTADWTYTLTDANNTAILNGILNQNTSIDIVAAMGTYTLTLTDHNNYTVSKSIVVSGTQGPQAVFAASTTNTTVNTNVSFTNSSTNATTYNWDFGDGTVITNIANPTYAYTSPGVYTVILTATSPQGCTSSTIQTITVTDNTATGINKPGTINGVGIWSSENKVYVDFRGLQKVDAVICFYNVLGQKISNDKFNSNMLYEKEVSNMEAAYLIVSVKNNDAIITKKVYINNYK